MVQCRQAKINAEAVLGRVVGAITGKKKEGENIVDITTTIDLLQVFWEAEKARNKCIGDVQTLSADLHCRLGMVSAPLLWFCRQDTVAYGVSTE